MDTQCRDLFPTCTGQWAEEEEKEGEEEGEEEEPAHLTRAQAKKLQIDVEKEIIENEKKTHDVEESRRLSLRNDTKLDDAENTSTVIESEADDTDQTIKRTRAKRNSKVDYDLTQRRSSRLRRKSEGDISDTPSGKGKKPNKSAQHEDEEEETSPKVHVDTPKKRGRRSKSASAPTGSAEPETRKTRSKISTDPVESENDEEAAQTASEMNNETSPEENDASDTKEANNAEGEDGNTENDEEVDEVSVLDAESAANSDGEGDDRPRRSSRKRKLDVNDDLNVKKPKTDIPATPPPKRRGRKPKIESRENSTEVDDTSTPTARRSTRRRP